MQPVHSTMSGRRPGQEHQARRQDREEEKDVVSPQDKTARTNVTKYAAHRKCQVERVVKLRGKVEAPSVGEGGIEDEHPGQLETDSKRKPSAHVRTRRGRTNDAKVELQTHYVQPDISKMVTEILETS